MATLRVTIQRLIERSMSGRIRNAPAISLSITYFNLIIFAAGLVLAIGVPFAFKNKVGGAIISGLFLVAAFAARQTAKSGRPVVAFNCFAVLLWLLASIQVVGSHQVGTGGLIVCSFLPAYGAIAGFGLAAIFAACYLAFSTSFFVALQMGLQLPIYFPGGITANILILLFALPVAILPLPTVFRQINEALSRAEKELEERRLAEQALQHSTERLADFSSGASDWFWETDTEHRFSFLSQQTDDRSAGARHRIIGHTRWELSKEVDPELAALWQDHRQKLAKHEVFRDFEYPIQTSTGAVRWMSVSGKPIFTVAGQFAGYRGSATDITQRKQASLELIQARDEAESANRSKSQFLANLSHEVRTPLNGILGMTSLLEMGELNAEQTEFVKQVKNSAHDLQAMLDRILGFAQLEAGNVKARQGPFALHETGGIALKRHEVAARKKGLAIELRLSPNLPAVVVGDSSLLLQILDNLLDNAIKFTDQGQVSLEIRVAERAAPIHRIWLEFLVSDSGCGIPPAQIASTFEAFRQGDGSITRKAGGNGLGLALCRSIVRLIKGEITVTSTVGSGSVFCVMLPFDTMGD